MKLQARACTLSAPALVLFAVLMGAVAEAASPGQDALDRGAQLYKQARYHEAIDAFREATRLDPGLLQAWHNLGWAYHRAGRHSEAIETWRTVLKVEPKRLELLNEVAAIQLGQSLWEEAARTLKSSLAIDADQPRIRLRLADAYEKAGSSREAEAQLREAARLRPGDLMATLRLQEFLERHAQEDAALEVLREALPRLAPYGHILKLRVARLSARSGDKAYRRGNYGEARASYAEAVRLDSRNAQYRINLGWAHRQLGDVAEATSAWRQALELQPGYGALYRHIADAALEQEDLSVATAMYLRAWAAADRRPSVPYRLAEIALDEGRSDDAALWLDELFRMPEADAEWSRRAAGLLARAQQAPLGIAFFRGRLAVSRHPEETRRALSSLHAVQGSAAYQAQDLETASRELEEAVRLDATNPYALRDLGWVYFTSDQWDAAARLWRHYAEVYPNETQPYNLLTHLGLKRKDYALAVASARSSLRLDSRQPEQRLKLATALYRSGEFAEARALAESLARENPEAPSIQLFWAELLMQYHDFDQGKPQWRRVLDLGLRTPKAEYYWVKSMYELGEYDAALDEARRLIEQEGPKQPLLQFLADDAMLRDDAQEAIRWYRLLTQHAPERLAGWLELARLQQQSGDLAGSRTTLDEARRRHPDRIDPVVALAELDRRAGRSDEAYTAFVSLNRAHPHQRDIFRGRLETALESGREDEALAVMRSGERTFFKGYEASMQEARILFAMGRESEAQRALAPVIGPRASVYVPVLLYHGLGDHPRSATMPVALFDAQLRALREQGFTAISLLELGRMLQGKQPFPPRPILITFDDARIDAFERADPVLARYGMKATMFVPTARILDDHPFFADWKRIRSFAATGRWDLQSHGHHAHDLIAVDAQQQLGSFLVNRQWLEDEARLESHEEYLERLDADYRQSIRELKDRFPEAEPIGYAFPFSEAGQENVGNEPRAAEVNQELLARHFRFGFVQDASGYNELRPSDAGTLLRRFSVPRNFDGEALLAHLAQQDPSAAALAQSARMAFWRGDYDRSRATWERLSAGQPRLRGEASYYLAAILYQRGRYDVARRHLQAAEVLGSERLQADPGLAQRIRWENGGRLVPRVDFSGDSDGRETLRQGVELHAGAWGPLEPSFAFGTVSLRQEGLAPLDGTELAAGLRILPFSHWTLEGRAWQRRLEPAGDSLSFSAGLGFENDFVELRLRGGREDLDTLEARLVTLQAERYAAHTLLRLSPSLNAVFDQGYARLDDGNERRDLSGRLVLRPRWGRGLGFGAAAGWSDTLFQSDLYYSPEEVRWARGVLSHQHSWGAGWQLETEIGLGLAEDELRGRRRTLHLAGRAGQAWGGRVRTFLEGRYGSSPGYESWGFGGALQLRF